MDIGVVVIICFGLAFILIGFFMMRSFQKGNHTGQNMEATVISTRKAGTMRSRHYFATLQYQINGQTYNTEISTDTINQPKEGSILIVGIDPQSPEKVNLRRGKGYIVFYAFGGATIIFAIVLAVL